MSVLSRLFNPKICKPAHIVLDYVPSVEFDDEGNQKFAFVKVDYPSIIKSHGRVTDWSLDALSKAGINPDFPIHTGFGTRLQGAASLDALANIADKVLAEPNEN